MIGGASVPRAFFVAGIGKGTEQAVGRVLLHGEAAKAIVEEVAAFIVDIDKCYENVQHDRLRRAALQHDFPIPLLTLCVNMYRARRTVAWDGVFANMTISGQTLVPGCSNAFWLETNGILRLKYNSEGPLHFQLSDCDPFR